MRQTIIYSMPQWIGMTLPAARGLGIQLGIWNDQTEGCRFMDIQVSQDFEGINTAAAEARDKGQDCVLLVLDWNAKARRNAWASLSPAVEDESALIMARNLRAATILPADIPGRSLVLHISTGFDGPDSWQHFPVYALLVSADGSTRPVN